MVYNVLFERDRFSSYYFFGHQTCLKVMAIYTWIINGHNYFGQLVVATYEA